MEIKNAIVVGAGTMGLGIAQFLAEKGTNVYLYRRSVEKLQNDFETIKSRINSRARKKQIDSAQVDTILGKINLASSIDDIDQVDLVIESIPERMDLKKALLDELSKKWTKDVIIATNTSSLSISELAKDIVGPERFIGVHFFSPVPMMPVVEVIPSLYTSQQVIEECLFFLKDKGKDPVLVKESPGFVVNRVCIPMINEACFLLMEGVTDAESIDKALTGGGGLVIGPLALGDFIGLDVVLDIMENYYHEFGSFKYLPCPLLRKMVRAGHLGRKTGRGFFKYS